MPVLIKCSSSLLLLVTSTSVEAEDEDENHSLTDATAADLGEGSTTPLEDDEVLLCLLLLRLRLRLCWKRDVVEWEGTGGGSRSSLLSSADCRVVLPKLPLLDTATSCNSSTGRGGDAIIHSSNANLANRICSSPRNIGGMLSILLSSSSCRDSSKTVTGSRCCCFFVAE